MQIVPVVSMNCSISECSNCVFHKSRFIQGISVDINLLNLAGRIGENYEPRANIEIMFLHCGSQKGIKEKPECHTVRQPSNSCLLQQE